MKEFAGPQSEAIMAFARLDGVVLRLLHLVPFPCLVMAGLVPATTAFGGSVRARALARPSGRGTDTVMEISA